VLQAGVTVWTTPQSIDAFTNTAFTVAMTTRRYVRLLHSTHTDWALDVIHQGLNLSTDIMLPAIGSTV